LEANISIGSEGLIERALVYVGTINKLIEIKLLPIEASLNIVLDIEIDIIISRSLS
jgi:hypothetical protein